MARPKRRDPLARRLPKREPYPRVLIVCEGSETEPNYLRELIAHYQLSGANVEIVGDGGSAPNSVVDYAINLFESDPDYESVFCVFDRDAHVRFDAAVQRVKDKALIRRQGKTRLGKAHFEAITSIPCFEYWILLHFNYTCADMPRFTDVARHLRAIPEVANYEKGQRGLFERTRDRLDDALNNADRANQAALAAGASNPTTKMPVLIRYLQQLSENKVR
jgi:hypothetical protein